MQVIDISHLDDEQQYNLGLAAEELLNSEAYKLVTGVLGGEVLQTMMSTEPKEKHRREDLYYLYQALDGVTQTLQAWVSTAIQIAQNNDNPEEGQ